MDTLSGYPAPGKTSPVIIAGTFDKDITTPPDYVECQNVRTYHCNSFAYCMSFSPPADILDTSNSSYISCDNPQLMPVTTTWKLTASPPSCCSLLKSS